MKEQPDFVGEVSALASLWIDRGHHLISSPVCHPELAGDGIEYVWGFMKRYYRTHNRGSQAEMNKRQRTLIMEACAPGLLDLARLRRFSRTAHEYRVVYAEWEAGNANAPFAHRAIEKNRRALRLKRSAFRHRNTDGARTNTPAKGAVGV